jgi:hypothetical protein
MAPGEGLARRLAAALPRVLLLRPVLCYQAPSAAGKQAAKWLGQA